MPLTDMQCRNARPGQRLKKLSDGGGLQLWIQPTGSRQWRLAYRFGGKQRLLALGPYPLLPLADARKHRDEAKRLLSDGIDPSEAKREAKRTQAQAGDTFRSIAEEYVSKLTKEGRAQATLTKLEWLLSFAYPKLGSRPIKGIAVPEVLEVLQKVEVRGRYGDCPSAAIDDRECLSLCDGDCSRRVRSHYRPEGSTDRSKSRIPRCNNRS